jgi:hypothetical protein
LSRAAGIAFTGDVPEFKGWVRNNFGKTRHTPRLKSGAELAFW